MRLKTLLGCMFLILVPATIQADDGEDPAAKFDVGGKIGLNIASHGGPGASSQYVSALHTLGFTIGGTAGVQLTEILAIQTDILFSDKGASYTMTGAPAGTYHLLYLEIPALARIALPLPGQLEYNVLLGPSLGILLDADIDLPDGEHVELENSFERLDVGLTIGAGVAVDIAALKGKLTIDARYNHGLLNIDKTAAPEDDDVMNRAFYFTLGYRTNLDTLLGGSSAASTSPQEPAPAPQPADAPAHTMVD